ncbi:helix-turn-helix domain-containing protein [Sinorhizobium meliloti]|uniref:helix-turn-helix domain-containing protein n=1 Tax=Rhizobium meliloti TaxID=382 RepID=UPI001F423441|nr:helix-turn-helix domain-containing protein [Sinorhizobium meliloti]
MSDPFPDEVDEALWDEACRRAEAVREFLKHRPGKMTAADVALLATEVETSRATAYRLIKLFRAGGTVMSLVDRKRGRPEGHRVLDDKREEIIRTTINRHYLTRNRPTFRSWSGMCKQTAFRLASSAHIAERSRLVSRKSSCRGAPNDAKPRS